MKRMSKLVTDVTSWPGRKQQEKMLSSPDESLQKAVRSGDVKDIEFLIEHGASTDRALHFAVKHGRFRSGRAVRAIEALIRLGVDVNAKDQKGRTPLMRAAEYSSNKVAKLLIRHGAYVDETDNDGVTALIQSAIRDRTEMADVLLRHGADADAKDNSGMTALMHAVSRNHPKVFSMLIRNGANLNEKDKVGMTALMQAARLGRVGVVEDLLGLGANVDVKDNRGMTALMHVVSRNRQEVFSMLVRSGANLNENDKVGWTVLMHAVQHSDAVLVNDLLRLGADVDAKEKDGMTALMHAAIRNHPKVLSVLIRNGASLSDKDRDGKTALMHAAQIGRVESAEAFIGLGANVDAKDNGGLTALMHAAIHNHPKVLSVLVQYGADLNEKDSDGMTALMHAAQLGRVGVVEDLLGLGANVDAKDNSGMTALIHAASRNRQEVLSVLVRIGADVNEKDSDGMTALMHAAIRNHPKVLSVLIRNGASLSDKDSDDKTALMHAAQRGRVESAEALIGLGANVDAKDNGGLTSLMLAASCNHHDVIVSLVRSGANLNENDNDGLTALMQGAQLGRVGVVEDLLGLGANVDVKDNSGMTALMHAVSRNHPKVLSVLIRNGANLNEKDKVGMTALMHAAQLGRVGVVEDLLGLGANVDAKDNSGMTALIHAASRNRQEVLSVLVRSGANLNENDNDGLTALMHAAQLGRADYVEELLERGANVDDKDNSSATALMYAVSRHYNKVTMKLIRHGADVECCYNNTSSYAVKSDSAYRDVLDSILQCKAFTQFKPSTGEVALFVAAATGDVALLQMLVSKSVNLDFASQDGRTALFYAAEHGHETAVQCLIASGANVALKSHSSRDSRLDYETPLTLAGRVGHMTIVEALVRAGAPVNVRSGVYGETPLVSVARYDNFPAVSLLMAHDGSALLDNEVQDDEYPLIPCTLATMEAMCKMIAFEFEPMIAHMVRCLQLVCSELQLRRSRHQQYTLANPTSSEPVITATAVQAHDDQLMPFAGIVYRACRLLFDIAKKTSSLSRFISSRAVVRRIQDIHNEIFNFARMQDLGLGSLEATTNNGDDNERVSFMQQLHTRFEQALSSDDALVVRRGEDDPDDETGMLLKYEQSLQQREHNRHSQDSIVQNVLTRYLRVNKIDLAPDVPAWFISRDDLVYHSWNNVVMNNKVKCYEGTWQGTKVTIEVSSLGLSDFAKTAAQWHRLSHPNVVKLFGACNVGQDKLFVFESTQDGVPLHEYLRASESNRARTWQCLHSAAMGLQYLHNRDVVHGCLQSDTIFVGSDSVVRLASIRGVRDEWRTDDRPISTWVARELVLLSQDTYYVDHSRLTTTSDVYAFGMCIWEATTLELPWHGSMTLALRSKTGRLPDHPACMSDAAWALIKAMCVDNPKKRVEIAHVVHRLNDLAFESTHTNNNIDVSTATCSGIQNKSHRVDEYQFVELGGKTIPGRLAYVAARCDELDDAQWIVANVLPALTFVFELLRVQEKSVSDDDVVTFCTLLARLLQYVRVATRTMSVYQRMRSRRVAESHRLVYTKLDELLDKLHVPTTDVIRVWRHVDMSSIVGSDARQARDDSESTSTNPISLHHLDVVPASYVQWTVAGLTGAAELDSTWRPQWYLSLRDLTFSKADQIGQGAFGAVYKGLWRGALVVIKFTGYEDDIKTVSTDLLLHEVRVWHKLNHPHVLKFYGASHVDKRYFVCEFAGNGELSTYLKRPGNGQFVWRKLHEAALGLQYLHNEGVVHNDLKGDNIMVALDGKAKLIDFGMSCLLGAAEIRIAKKHMGAINWRSPEYLAGGPPSRASDVYSFAMCIVEAVSGAMPWEAPMTPPQIKYQLNKGNVPSMPESTTAQQRNLIARMSTLDPDERANMAFVVTTLYEIAQQEELANR